MRLHSQFFIPDLFSEIVLPISESAQLMNKPGIGLPV